ncbi:Hypothetical predicted protein [Lynx pardinus]|uniref:Uncharacterized protein n=1 Tax=Lynx pardinus TaxID=191816 RepID=A0A485NJS1_LYNPA|nr:Hypothetical predicted protein [Lynx pardinus]
MARHRFGVPADFARMATSTLSFIVAVNAPFLSFSPLKIREHTGSGCVRQSIPRVVGRGGCGSDGSPHWGSWKCYEAAGLTDIPASPSCWYVFLSGFTLTRRLCPKDVERRTAQSFRRHRHPGVRHLHPTLFSQINW